MSEYQYYEFRAIDRPLDEEEMDALRELSTRAEITPTSFTKVYHYGSFRGDPPALMDRYFDAFVYVANWGTHRLMVRIPRQFLDVEVASMCCDGEYLALRSEKDHVVLEFYSREEGGGGWEEGEAWMPALVPIRAELMRGDLRALYLGWLAALPERAYDEEVGEELEPPVPPGLARLSKPLQALGEFLRVDEDLLEVAAAASTGAPPTEPSREEMARWIEDLPTRDKDVYLLRFLNEEGDLLLRAELSKRFREATAPRGSRAGSGTDRRTVAQLLGARAALSEERTRQAEERAAEERARREREVAEAHSRHLDGLASREAAKWREVEDLIATKRPKDYDRAVTLLADLCELAERSGRGAEARDRIGELRRRHAGKPSLIRRLDDSKLGG